MDSNGGMCNTRAVSYPLLPPNVEEIVGIIGGVVIVAPTIREVITEAISLDPTPTRTEANIY